ncbi:MAG TPA: hypothetical protein VMB77_04840 [Syntrophales bacterium]|nr:hypothetical protein [Syntrophales bacterium]
MAANAEFNVIVGDVNDAFVEIVAETVAEALDPCHRLRVHGTSDTDRILALADERPVDLFVLFLNNLTFGKWGSNLDADSFVKALLLVRHLKAFHGKPIMATAAFPAEFLYKDIALRFGADCFLRMPFEMSDFLVEIRTLFPERARQQTDLRPVPCSVFRPGSPGFHA